MDAWGRFRDRIEGHHAHLVGEHPDAVEMVANGRLEYVGGDIVVVDLDAWPSGRPAHGSDPVDSAEGLESPR
jgi:hypothetical protein